MRYVVIGALVAIVGCGFGHYNDDAAPQQTSSNDGVWDAGPWWPWACQLPDGTFSNPSSPSTPIEYTASGSCGQGGAFALSVDGCEMLANWDALGLTDVTTVIPSSIPEAGGWEIAVTGAAGDGGTSWTCDAKATDAVGDLTLTCTSGATTACESTLTRPQGS